MDKNELEKGFHQIDLKGMTAEQLASFLTPFIELAGFEWEMRETDAGQKLLTIAIDLKKQEKKRTLTQNSALHKLFELWAKALNDAGYPVQVVIQKTPDIQFTKYNIKELLWRPIQKSSLGKESTTELTTKEIDTVYDEVNKFLAENFKIHEPFPSIEEIMNKMRELGNGIVD